MIRCKFTLYIIALLHINLIFSALHPNTLIQANNKSLKIKNLHIGDLIHTFELNKKTINDSFVAHIYSKPLTSCYKIQLPNATIYCTGEQLLYDPQLSKWIPAKKITSKTTFLDIHNNIIPCVSVEKVFIKKLLHFYDISINYPHTFFISESQVLTHNVIPIVVGISILFGEEIAIAGVGFALGALGAGLWRTFGKNNKTELIKFDTQISNSSPSGSPADPEKDKREQARNDFQPLTNKEARIKAKELGYHEVKDAPFNSHNKPTFKKGNDWITPDRDGHNGGVWKRFYKGNRIGTYNANLTIKIGK